ncbi:MAG TPA: hypothetical protein VEW03_10430 [Longimicrobiaceae bacterium]|nr:hypothetical protein [Longimicrobiaceae bacterium]
MSARRVPLLAALALAACAPAPGPPAPAGPPLLLTPQRSGTTALLQAVSPVSDRVAWASGHRGTYVRTTDGGATWTAGTVPGADSLEFRDVHAVDERTAYLLSAGNGELSRIYKTTDAGRSWTRQFLNRDPRAFFDCFDFWDAQRGVAFSDAVEGRHVVLTTMDGGGSWVRVADAALPAALPGEGAFAASGTCVVARGAGEAWIGTGNSPRSRVLRTGDYGRSWTAVEVPIPAGEAAGIASLAFRDGRHGAALGGDIGDPAGRGDAVALTADGGRSWTRGARPGFPGAVYGAAYAPGARTPVLAAVGPGGLEVSTDGARSWVRADTAAYWSVGFASPRAGWAVGPGGRITRLAVP